MNDDTIILKDHLGRTIRIPHERYTHLLDHPEMTDQIEKIKETLTQAELIVATTVDESVQVYHRYYATTPVTSKYLLVAVKVLDTDAFVLTAFFSRRQKKGKIIWQA